MEPARSKPPSGSDGRVQDPKERCAKQHYAAAPAPRAAWRRAGCDDIIPRARSRAPAARRTALATDKELSDFLKSVEKRAFKRTVYAVRNDDAALDIVQDAMIRLAEKYADRPAAELPLIFQRILSNATMDWFRRQKVRNAVMQQPVGLRRREPDGDFDLLETAAGRRRLAGHRERRRCRVAGTDPAADRRRGGRAADTSTGGLPAALLGGIRRGRDSGGDGLLGRQRQDALLAGGSCTGKVACAPRESHYERATSRSH